MKGKIVSINISGKKGTAKTPVHYITILKDFGLKDDAHGGNHHRQVSLLGKESIDMVKKQGHDIHCGSFGENITTEGITLYELPLTTLLRIRDVVLEVTQIGKTCHRPCAIFYEVGSCIMPKQGIFAKVLNGGDITVGDTIEVTTK